MQYHTVHDLSMYLKVYAPCCQPTFDRRVQDSNIVLVLGLVGCCDMWRGIVLMRFGCSYEIPACILEKVWATCKQFRTFWGCFGESLEVWRFGLPSLFQGLGIPSAVPWEHCGLSEARQNPNAIVMELSSKFEPDYVFFVWMALWSSSSRQFGGLKNLS